MKQIIVSGLYYDVVHIKWINKNVEATIRTEREIVIEEMGKPQREELNEFGNLNMIYDYRSSVQIVKVD